MRATAAAAIASRAPRGAAPQGGGKRAPAREAVDRLRRRLPGPLGLPEGPRPARRVRVPTVLQMEAVECGAAALAKVLAYHGKVVPLEEVRQACGVSRDGSKASNVLKAARGYGLDAKGYKREPEALKTVPGPAILHWNFNHFLVLEGFKKGRVYLNDPGMGPRVVTEEEFDQAFTGVVLTFEPGPAFEAGGRKRTLAASLRPRLRGSEMALLYVVAAGLLLVVPGLVAAVFSKVFVDSILVGGNVDWLRPLVLFMAVTAAVAAGLTWLQRSALLRLETKLAASTSGQFFWHVLRLPFSFFTQRFGGEIGSRVAINDKVSRLLSGELATTVLSVVTAVFYAALMVQYDLVLTVAGVAVSALNLIALKVVSRRRKEANQRMLAERGKVMGAAMGGLQTIETLKASGSENDFFARWAGFHAKASNAQQELGLYSQVLAVVPPLLVALNTAVVLGLGALRVMDGEMTMGMLVAFQALTASFIAPVNQLVGLGGTLQEVEGDLGRLDDVLRAAPERPSDPAGEAPARAGRGGAAAGDGAGGDGTAVGLPAPPVVVRPKLDGRLELRGVTFGYSPLEAPLIEDFSLSLRPGQRVALVGGSGVGEEHGGQARLRAVRAVVRRDPPRRRAAGPGAGRGARELIRVRGPGHLPVRGDGPRQPHAVGRVGRRRGRSCGRRRTPASTTRSPSGPGATSGPSRRAAGTSRAGSGSGSRSPGRSSGTRRCSCSTRRRARWTRPPRRRSTTPSAVGGARASSWPTG